jgi:hypothetical protein
MSGVVAAAKHLSEQLARIIHLDDPTAEEETLLNKNASKIDIKKYLKVHFESGSLIACAVHLAITTK